MDEMTWFFVLIGAGFLLTILFWVGVIYLVYRLISGSNLSSQQKIGIASGLLSNYQRYGGSSGSSEPGPIASSIHQTAASHGIDLNK